MPNLPIGIRIGASKMKPFKAERNGEDGRKDDKE